MKPFLDNEALGGSIAEASVLVRGGIYIQHYLHPLHAIARQDFNDPGSILDRLSHSKVTYSRKGNFSNHPYFTSTQDTLTIAIMNTVFGHNWQAHIALLREAALDSEDEN